MAASSCGASPDEVETTNAFRWGLGAGFPSRKALRFTAELTGERTRTDTLATKQVLTAEDGSFLPVGFISDVRSPIDLNLGLTWQGANGVFAGAGWTWRMTMDTRDHFLSQYTNGAGDKMDLVGARGLSPGRAHLRAAAAAAAATRTTRGAAARSAALTRSAIRARWKSARRRRSRAVAPIPRLIGDVSLDGADRNVHQRARRSRRRGPHRIRKARFPSRSR